MFWLNVIFPGMIIVCWSSVKLVAAARRDPPQVIGDGMQHLQLVDKSPRPDAGEAMSLLTKIHLDEISLTHLAAQELTADSIPVKGCVLFCVTMPIYQRVK